ncbi:YjcZ family sporulation protein [Paenibacillus sp. KN14-4R]
MGEFFERGGLFTSTGTILVLFILLVIITRTFLF